MRLCICGLHRDGAVKMVEEKLNVESINVDFPGMEDSEYKLFHHAAETFKYFDKKNVVFDGGVFDDIKFYSDQGWTDLQEEVIHSSVMNLDKIVIITEGMNDKLVELFESFKELYQDKIQIVNNENEFSIR